MSDISNWLNRQNEEYKRKVIAWQKAQAVIGYDPNSTRKDAYGSFIVWGEYGQQTANGWEIDHELPKAHFPGAANQPANLRALHWKNNRAKSDKIDASTLGRILGGY